MQARTVLAFDYGLRRIGVAVGNELLARASALPALPARDGVPDWSKVRSIIDEWQPQRLVVGLPLNMDDTPSDMSARAERFARRLQGRFGLPCDLVDERLSSAEARSRLADRGYSVEQRLDAVDSEAARIILEAWFSAQATR